MLINDRYAGGRFEDFGKIKFSKEELVCLNVLIILALTTGVFIFLCMFVLFHSNGLSIC
jgi:hypothetical protein